MTADRGYWQFRAYLAVAQLAIDTISAAITRAERAMAHIFLVVYRVGHGQSIYTDPTFAQRANQEDGFPVFAGMTLVTAGAKRQKAIYGKKEARRKLLASCIVRKLTCGLEAPVKARARTVVVQVINQVQDVVHINYAVAVNIAQMHERNRAGALKVHKAD